MNWPVCFPISIWILAGTFLKGRIWDPSLDNTVPTLDWNECLLNHTGESQALGQAREEAASCRRERPSYLLLSVPSKEVIRENTCRYKQKAWLELSPLALKKNTFNMAQRFLLQFRGPKDHPRVQWFPRRTYRTQKSHYTQLLFLITKGCRLKSVKGRGT